MHAPKLTWLNEEIIVVNFLQAETYRIFDALSQLSTNIVMFKHYLKHEQDCFSNI